MYNRPRVIPCLTLMGQDLVKTVNFKRPNYIGDPINSVKIFNNKGVDELCILDITATKENREPAITYLKEIAEEAFMPLSYGGGISNIDQIKRLFRNGYEKVILNTAFYKNSSLIKEAVKFAGSQSVVVSIDSKRDMFGNNVCYVADGSVKVKESPVQLARLAEELGAGEILLNSIDRDGTMRGYDLNLITKVTAAVSIPVIACGGAGRLADFADALHIGKAHAVAAGSYFIYYGVNRAVLITAPTEEELIEAGIYNDK